MKVISSGQFRLERTTGFGFRNKKTGKDAVPQLVFGWEREKFNRD